MHTEERAIPVMRPLGWLSRHRGVLLALVLATAALARQPRPEPLEQQHSDSWVYDAMAEHPSVFTAQPWGYRILGPWIVHSLPANLGFAHLSVTALAATAVLLYLYLRRMGNGELPSLAAVTAFGLSVPVAEGLFNPYLCEPLTVLVETIFLLAIEWGAGLGVLSLIGVFAALSKEILLVLLPLVYFARREQDGHRRALVAAILVALPAIGVTALMRLCWTPHLKSAYAVPGFDVLPLVLPSLEKGETGVLLAGLTPLAALGALRSKAGPFRRRYGYLALTFLILPFVAWAYDPRPNRVPFFGATVRRLLIYELPLVLPLALLALDRVWPHFRPEPNGPRRPRATTNAVASLVAWILATVPLWGLDHYRRIELNRGGFYGPVVRAICLKTVKVAEQLDRGERVSYFKRDSSAPQIRWFLRDGWGSYPYLETGEVVMQRRAASVLIPCFRPDALDLALTLRADKESAIQVDVNGTTVATLRVGPEAREQRLRIPRSTLFRGDNILGLTAVAGDDPLLSLEGLTLRHDDSKARS